MNNYAEWWNQTVTIYNKYEDSATHIVSWYKRVVPNCFWKYVGNRVMVGSTVLETNDTICRIRKSASYKQKYVWDQLSAQDKALNFTLAPGDLIVKGSVSDTINEYTAGSRATDLVAKYKALQGVMKIERVAEDVDGGRGSEHYYVRGV